MQEYLNSVENWLQLSDEQSDEVLVKLTEIYKRHIASEVLVEGKTELPNQIEVIITAVSAKIQKEVEDFGWDELEARVDKVFTNVMSIFQFQTVNLYILELTKVITQSFVNYTDLKPENEEEVDRLIEKAKGVYEIILSVFLTHEKENPIQPTEIQKRMKFIYDIFDHINYLRLTGNGKMTDYQLKFSTEITTFLFSKLKAISNELSYKTLLTNSFSFVVMVPKYSKKTVTTTIQYQDIANVNTFSCLNDLIFEKISRDSLVDLKSTADINLLGQQYQLMDLVINIKEHEKLKEVHENLILNNIQKFFTLPLRIAITQQFKLPIFHNGGCGISEDTYEIFNAYYNDWILFRAQNENTFATMPQVTQEKMMNMYDDLLTDRNVPHKYPFKLMNLYNPSSDGNFVFPAKDSMTADEFDLTFRESLNKPAWKFYFDYLNQLKQHLDKDNKADFYEYYQGKTLERDEVLAFYEEVASR